MTYTVDAMISVLQKAENVTKERQAFRTESADELDCYHIAHTKKYFQTDISKKVYGILPSGLTELARLIKIRDRDKREQETYKREVERHAREKVKLGIDITALVISIISLIIAGGTFLFVIFDHKSRHIMEQDTRLMDCTELLPNQPFSTQSSNADCDTSKSNSNTGNTCTDVHKD